MGEPEEVQEQMKILTVILVLVEKMKKDENPDMVNLSKCPFWVRIYDLPISRITKAMAECIANTMGKYMEWDESEANRLGRSIRGCVKLDVTKSLHASLNMKFAKKDPIRVKFKYER